MKKLGVALVVLIFVASCSNGKEAELKKLRDDVMVIHDEVMPLMDPLYKIRISLEKKMEEDSAIAVRSGLIKAIADIKVAEEDMMNWMRNYDVTFKGKDDIETAMYLEEQKESIEEVAARMKEAIKKGEDILGKY